MSGDQSRIIQPVICCPDIVDISHGIDGARELSSIESAISVGVGKFTRIEFAAAIGIGILVNVGSVIDYYIVGGQIESSIAVVIFSQIAISVHEQGVNLTHPGDLLGVSIEAVGVIEIGIEDGLIHPSFSRARIGDHRCGGAGACPFEDVGEGPV